MHVLAHERLDLVAKARELGAIVVMLRRRRVDQGISKVDGAEQNIRPYFQQRLLPSYVRLLNAPHVRLNALEISKELYPREHPETEHRRKAEQKRETHSRTSTHTLTVILDDLRPVRHPGKP